MKRKPLWGDVLGLLKWKCGAARQGRGTLARLNDFTDGLFDGFMHCFTGGFMDATVSWMASSTVGFMDVFFNGFIDGFMEEFLDSSSWMAPSLAPWMVSSTASWLHGGWLLQRLHRQLPSLAWVHTIHSGRGGWCRTWPQRDHSLPATP
jgi:hypothetical protein